MSLVSLAQGITDLAVRVGQECKSIRALAATKEPIIASGLMSQIFRGDKSWSVLNGANLIVNPGFEDANTDPHVAVAGITWGSSTIFRSGGNAAHLRCTTAVAAGDVFTANGSGAVGTGPKCAQGETYRAEFWMRNGVSGTTFPTLRVFLKARDSTGTTIETATSAAVTITNTYTLYSVELTVSNTASQYLVCGVNAPSGLVVGDAWRIDDMALRWVPPVSTTLQATLDADFTRPACRVATRNAGSTTDNIALSGLQTIDGVALAAGDRVLVNGQTNAVNNGIYIAASGAWARASDANTTAQMTSGLVMVSSGTVNTGTLWTLVLAAGGTLGSSAVIGTQVLDTSDVDYGAARAVSNGTDQTHSSSGTWQLVTLDTLAYASANGVQFAGSIFTVPRTGIYHFTAAGCFTNVLGTAPRRAFQIESFTSTEALGSGNQIARQEIPMVTGIFPAFSLAGEVALNAGDKVRLVAYQNSGSTLLIKNTTGLATMTMRHVPST